jgi:hypothetical protein
MYRIDRQGNRLIKLGSPSFSQLGYHERFHLQEWIAQNPEVLQEELLILQKEYSGWNDTNERLDLLALDKNGDLVVIENKLDDSGKDVVWQGIKYASYCSTLTADKIVDVYGEFLEASNSSEAPRSAIAEFLGTDEENLRLNEGDVRIIFVAREFRKEVTSAVLWLLKFGLSIKCYRVVPYGIGGDEFLQVDQIIPLPETSDFVISSLAKERQNQGKPKTLSETDLTLLSLWQSLKSKLERKNIKYLQNVTPKPYFYIGFSLEGGYYGFCIGRTGYRVELYFGNDTNKIKYDSMYRQRHVVENSFTLGEITWQRLEGKKASRIKFEKSSHEINPDNPRFWEDREFEPLLDWYAEAMRAFVAAVHPVWLSVKSDLE